LIAAHGGAMNRLDEQTPRKRRDIAVNLLLRWFMVGLQSLARLLLRPYVHDEYVGREVCRNFLRASRKSRRS